jgi:ectoine hydroxylase-related dioxygenase (phytanoyl-CoA dioxygenase family)
MEQANGPEAKAEGKVDVTVRVTNFAGRHLCYNKLPSHFRALDMWMRRARGSRRFAVENRSPRPQVSVIRCKSRRPLVLQKTTSEQNMFAPTDISQLDENGFAVVPSILDQETIQRVSQLVDVARAANNSENVANSSGTYGLRNLTDVVPEVAELVRHPAVVELVRNAMVGEPFMVRSTLFDKTPGANWGVFWHQDLSIAVEQRHEVAGFSAWTRKAGVQCVQPPVETMRQILAVRLHLDDCFASNGALKVLPRTHKLSKLTTAAVEAQQQHTSEVVCEVAAGGAVLMRPLLLHASSPMDVEASRRVIHFEFASFELPPPLQWRYRIPTK